MSRFKNLILDEIVPYCPNTLPETYIDFNNTFSSETNFEVNSIEMILGRSVSFPVYRNLRKQISKILYSNPTSAITGEMGVYLCWDVIDYDSRNEQYLLECIYVGKGWAKNRVDKHLKKKMSNNRYFITFYECENRIAKYIEQLFLDYFYFDLNRSENHGKEPLYHFIDDMTLVNGCYRFQAIDIERHMNDPRVQRSMKSF
ncbi:hypothetical protein [Vibrio splendidus]|uniref:hypothetical protein n=1 Tax=Vibrio splendidus TaxID=29497 RepID=UPI00076A1E17|nr:hypothetical protein [Vibrio splendidus]